MIRNFFGKPGLARCLIEILSGVNATYRVPVYSLVKKGSYTRETLRTANDAAGESRRSADGQWTALAGPSTRGSGWTTPSKFIRAWIFRIIFVDFIAQGLTRIRSCSWAPRNGRGTLTKPNGDVFEGLWKDNMKHGNGTFYYMEKGMR